MSSSGNKTKVAVFGLNGELGKPLIEAFTSDEYKGQYALPIRAATRDPSKFSSTNDVEYVRADINDAESLKTALDGVDVVLDVTAAATSSKPLIDAAVAAGVSVYFLSEFGCDLDSPGLKWIPPDFAVKFDEAKHAEQYPQLKTVSVRTSLFADIVVPRAPGLFGIDVSNKKAIKYEGYENKFSVIWVADISKAVASVAYKDPKALPDVIKLHGSSVSIKDIIEYYEQKEGAKFDLTPFSWEDSKNLAAESERKLNQNDFSSPAEAGGLFINILRAYGLNPEDRSVVDFADNNNNDLIDFKFKQWKE
ncbi:hypothetical protein TRICI_001420 [Trichomonascus ciferrii]|uniref:NmrA-like domain-containing protein n=1 Tax=Trichomonascus ciferrii TaxID=44093 RepID=A0A642VCF4_9ASCO|nr:hypothetical protein TRICI_001420 [Trichomonascus ciferrii]